MAIEPLASQRQLFDVPDDVAYLNCAYFSPKPHSVLEAGRRAIEALAHPWDVAPRHFFEPAERLRSSFATLINGDADGVAFVPSVSYGIGVAAQNLEVGPGRTVVLAENQFPSDVYPWRALVDDSGGSVVTVAEPASGRWTEAVLDAIDETTAVVCVPPCHWSDGRAYDLEEIGAAARHVGSALVVDGSQAIGAAPFDVAAVKPDFLVTVGYKWQFGPFSYCYLWVAPEHRTGIPLEATWIGRKGSEDFARLVDYVDDYQPGARRYDVGEYSNFQLVPMAQAALDLLLELDPEQIAATIEPLTDAVESGARELGLDPVPRADRLAHLMGVRFPKGLPVGLRERLVSDRVFVSVRGNAVRVGPNVYNSMDDVDRLLATFASAT